MDSHAVEWEGLQTRYRGVGLSLFLGNVTLAGYFLEMCIFIYGLDTELFSLTGLSWESNGNLDVAGLNNVVHMWD